MTKWTGDTPTQYGFYWHSNWMKYDKCWTLVPCRSCFDKVRIA